MPDYRPMLELADELELFTGYMDTARQQEAGKVRQTYDQKRREFVYDLIKSEPDRSLLWPKVAADLDRMETAGEHYPGAIDRVRADLQKHIAKQAGSHPILRFATRWALPAAVAGAAILHFYLQAQRN